MTEAEKRLWSRLRRGQMGVRFRRQQPIGPYVADFYCASAKLIGEVDGGQHNEMRKAHDARRDAWLRSEGYSIVRFWNTDVLANTEGVLTELMLALAAADAASGDNPSSCLLLREEGGISGRGS
jgi:BirA family biotin operon repressor/biotin-[acetyl-CoA-carboxylase] ligase